MDFVNDSKDTKSNSNEHQNIINDKTKDNHVTKQQTTDNRKVFAILDSNSECDSYCTCAQSSEPCEIRL